MPNAHLTIDFVSDISCPWCAVGLAALQQALQRVPPEVSITLRFQPFELNPHMGPGGQDLGEHLTQKYGSTPEQQARVRQVISARGAEAGFAFHPDGRGRVYNTFAAHRLLHWAAETAPERQPALKLALLQACHRDQQVMEDPEVLVAAAEAAGLDGEQARAVLASDAYTQDVRERQQWYLQAGIQSVPAVVFNERHLVSGAQTAEVYENVMRQLAAAD